jgi:hypothetical protein
MAIVITNFLDSVLTAAHTHIPQRHISRFSPASPEFTLSSCPTSHLLSLPIPTRTPSSTLHTEVQKRVIAELMILTFLNLACIFTPQQGPSAKLSGVYVNWEGWGYQLRLGYLQFVLNLRGGPPLWQISSQSIITQSVLTWSEAAQNWKFSKIMQF